MLRKPFADLRMPVRGIVVDDRVDRLSLGHVRVDLIEEADEFLMPMALHVAADNGAVEDSERGEQRGGAVALVVVRHRSGATWLHRQSRLGVIERLDLALLIDREDDGMGGRVDIETDHIPELVGELRIVRQLECPDTVRREMVGLKDALHRPQADPYRLGQHPSRPMSGFSRRRPGHEVDNLLDGRGRQRWLARFARLVVQQPINALLINRACQRHTTGLALPDRRMISAVPQPSAVARMIWARHTCFCSAQRSATIRSSRRRSTGMTLTTIPALITRA